ncbi:putative F-box protein [Acorus calamus]|uniref:F-box protein n=1 Tax=Acorus calamus TaxID=4465 RepID=A0AAV9D8S2_ACOCL|nr:putative F-box protein [Acorus calamus]
MAVDRLNGLPDDVLHQILSSLNTKEKVRTRILSKRWRDLFSSIPTLDYCFNSIHGDHYKPFSKYRLDHRRNYIDIVDGLLRLSKSTHLRLLHLDFFIANDGPPFPDQWLRFVAGLSSVTDLVICFQGIGDWNPKISRFRSSVLSLNRTLLTVRSLTLDRFKPSGFPWCGFIADGCYFGSLKSLSLSDVCISDEDFASMLKLCPPLESIRVDRIHGLTLSDRDACRLETLDVCVRGDVEIGPALRLRVFRLKTYRGTLSMKGVPALREATLSMCSPSEDSSFQFDEAVSSLKSIESLTIDRHVLKVIRDRDVHCSLGLFDNVKRLHLDLSYDKTESSYCTVVASLRYFPYVEELSIQCLHWRCSSKDITCAIDGSYQLNHLKVIKFMTFYPREEAEMQLFKFLLQRTVILEKFHLPSYQSVHILELIDDLDFERFPGLLNDVKCLNLLHAGCNEELIVDAIISHVRHLQRLKEFTRFPVKYLVDIDFDRFPGLFDNIKSLDLRLRSHSMKFTNGTIAAGLRHFRHLEELSISYSYESKKIPITGAIDGYYPMNHLKTINVNNFHPGEADMQLLKFLLGSAVILETFHMSMCSDQTVETFQHINDLDFERFPGVFDDVWSLNLRIPSHSAEPMYGIIVAGLRHFRCLKKLSIEYTDSDNRRNDRTCAIDGSTTRWELEKRGILGNKIYALNRLEVIRMTEFSGREKEIQLIEFLLGSAVVLVDFYMTLCSPWPGSAKHESQVLEYISLLYRASHNARLKLFRKRRF